MIGRHHFAFLRYKSTDGTFVDHISAFFDTGLFSCFGRSAHQLLDLEKYRGHDFF